MSAQEYTGARVDLRDVSSVLPIESLLLTGLLAGFFLVCVSLRVTDVASRSFNDSDEIANILDNVRDGEVHLYGERSACFRGTRATDTRLGNGLPNGTFLVTFPLARPRNPPYVTCDVFCYRSPPLGRH